jgi:uncharacterized membrane protein (TIGR02234 family)
MAEPRRALWVVVLLLVVAALLSWVASLLVWTWDVRTSGGTAVVTQVRGAQAQPAMVGLPVVALASVAGVLATSGRLRRAIGALVVAIGVGALVVAGRGFATPRTQWVSDVGFERWADDIDGWWVQALTGMGLTVLAGLLLVVAGGWVLAAGHRMPRMGARYQRTGQSRAAGPPERQLWQEFDAGRDPTDH